jgi:uncharacterized protein (DUF983 family)
MKDMICGARGACPHCRRGKLFRSWLTVADQCTDCDEAFHHHRADDLPAYLVVLILGHLMVGFALELERHFAPPFWWHCVLTLPLATLLALIMLQPVKGAVVALQWRMGMHGFKNRIGLLK